MSFVYILKSLDGRYYVGSTNNLDRRMLQHTVGHTPTTKRMQQPQLVFNQEFPDLKTARQIELKIKKLKRKDYIEKIISDGFIKLKV